MYNWTSNQTVLILKTEWVVCTIGVPYKQYFAKMIKFNGLYFLYWSSKIKIQLLCTSVIYVQLMCKKTLFILKTVGRSIVQLLHLDRAFQAAELCRKGPRGYDWWEDTSMQKGQPFDIRPRFLTISITRFFFLKTRW